MSVSFTLGDVGPGEADGSCGGSGDGGGLFRAEAALGPPRMVLTPKRSPVSTSASSFAVEPRTVVLLAGVITSALVKGLDGGGRANVLDGSA